MTPKQIEKLKKQIDEIKRTLAAEKRKFGAYDDGQGLRYLPAKYYVQLQDYANGLIYLKWFDKDFSDDSGFPDFLFEWTIILFKNGLTKSAEKKAFETFCSNTYLFDKYFGRPLIHIDKWEGSNLEDEDYVEDFIYSSKQAEFLDFSEWLRQFTRTDKFINLSTQYIDIQKRLKTERNYESRYNLVKQANGLADSL